MDNSKKYIVEADFTHAGSRCVVIIGRNGYRCGYVGIPKTNKLYGVDYNNKVDSLNFKDISSESIGKRSLIAVFCHDGSDKISPFLYFNVHGGITYSGGDGYPVESENLWWFGYDCGHAGDGKDLSVMDGRLKEIELMYPMNGIVRSLEYCIEECKQLAEQLKKFDAEMKNCNVCGEVIISSRFGDCCSKICWMDKYNESEGEHSDDRQSDDEDFAGE